MEDISEFDLSALKEDHCNLYSNNETPTSSFSKRAKMTSNFTELFRTVLHFFLPECIDSCAERKPQKVAKSRTSCRRNHNSASNSLRPNKFNETSCKETQTDASCFSSSGLTVHSFSLMNSDAQQEKCMEERLQCCCCSESNSIRNCDLDHNNNYVTINEVISSHHPVDSSTFDERCDPSSNEDCVYEVKTEYGTTEGVQELTDNVIPFFYDLYKLPVFFKDFANIESSNSISVISTVETIQDHIVWTNWAYPILSSPSHQLTDENLAQRNDYNCLQDMTDSWLVHWPYFILDGEVTFLNIPQYSSLIDNVPEENFAENDIYFEDDYLQDFTPSESECVHELVEDLECESFFQTSDKIEELFNSSVKGMAGKVHFLKKSCRQKHYSTSDVPHDKTVTMTCCKETQTEESCFDTYCVQSSLSDPLLGLQIAFECSTISSTSCIEDSTKDPFISTDKILT